MSPLFRNHIARLAIACVAIALMLVAAGVADACPSCKAALASQGKGDLVAGFFWSILFMLSMPFAILGSFSSYMYFLVRRARREEAAKQSDTNADEVNRKPGA